MEPMFIVWRDFIFGSSQLGLVCERLRYVFYENIAQRFLWQQKKMFAGMPNYLRQGERSEHWRRLRD